MKVIKCSCGKVLEEIADMKEEITFTQKNLGCRECRKNHMCCVVFSVEHAVDFLRQVGFTVIEPKK